MSLRVIAPSGAAIGKEKTTVLPGFSTASSWGNPWSIKNWVSGSFLSAQRHVGVAQLI